MENVTDFFDQLISCVLFNGVGHIYSWLVFTKFDTPNLNSRTNVDGGCMGREMLRKSAPEGK
jgi:hypothetical protein